MPLAETQMYIFRIALRSLLFGWNALAVECNRKRALRSITFLFHNACKTADLAENPLRKLCVLCASAVNDGSSQIHRRGAEDAEFTQRNPWLSLDIVLFATIITAFYVKPFNAVRLFSQS